MADRNAHIKISFDSDNTAYISGTSSSGITCTLSPDGYKLTFVFDRYILGGNYSNFGSYDTTNSIFTLTKPIEFLTRSATGEIVNRGEVISVSPPSQENSYTYVATIEEISKTKLDLSTLSDIADGTHTVKVKAKANGYRDSEFSNEVSYTKAPAGYSGTVTKTGGGIVYYEINKDTITNYQNLTTGRHNFTNVASFYCESGEELYYISITNTVNCGAVTHNTGCLITPTADNFSFTVSSEPR